MLRSYWNPNRFLRSINRSYWGNPQPTRVAALRLSRRMFNSTNKAGRKIRRFKVIFLRRSDPHWRNWQ